MSSTVFVLIAGVFLMKFSDGVSGTPFVLALLMALCWDYFQAFK